MNIMKPILEDKTDLRYAIERCLKAERERDEALAQVAVLLHDYKMQQTHGGLISPNIEAEARALLDRLQRAEAVVAAMRQIETIADNSAFGGKLWSEYLQDIRRKAREALAAWEEHK